MARHIWTLLVGVACAVLAAFIAYVEVIADAVASMSVLTPQVNPDMTVSPGTAPSPLLVALGVGVAGALLAALAAAVFGSLVARLWPRVAGAIIGGPAAFLALCAFITSQALAKAAWAQDGPMILFPSDYLQLGYVTVAVVLPTAVFLGVVALFSRARPRPSATIAGDAYLTRASS